MTHDWVHIRKEERSDVYWCPHCEQKLVMFEDMTRDRWTLGQAVDYYAVLRTPAMAGYRVQPCDEAQVAAVLSS